MPGHEMSEAEFLSAVSQDKDALQSLRRRLQREPRHSLSERTSPRSTQVDMFKSKPASTTNGSRFTSPIKGAKEQIDDEVQKFVVRKATQQSPNGN